MVYGAQGILENANYYGTVSDDYNVLAECYEGVLMFEQNMSDIMTAVGAAEFTYLKETGEMKVYNEADKASLKVALQNAIETLKTKLCDVIDKVVVWFNQAVVSGVLNSKASKVDINKIDGDVSVTSTTAYHDMKYFAEKFNKLEAVAKEVSSGAISSYSDMMDKLTGSADGTAATFMRFGREGGDEDKELNVHSYFNKCFGDLKDKATVKILSQAKSAIKSIKISKDMDESKVTEIRKCISTLGAIYSKCIYSLKESTLTNVNVVKAGIKAALGKEDTRSTNYNAKSGAKAFAGKLDKDGNLKDKFKPESKPAAKNESSFLDGFLDSIY